MTAHNKKSCLGYLNKLVDEHNNTYHHYIGKKPVDADNSALTEEIDTNLKCNPKYKVGDAVRITKLGIFLVKGKENTNTLIMFLARNQRRYILLNSSQYKLLFCIAQNFLDLNWKQKVWPKVPLNNFKFKKMLAWCD